jgi:hypothetical protein
MNVTPASAASSPASSKSPQANPGASDRRFAELLASPSCKLTVSEDGTVLANDAAPSADGRRLEVGGKISTLSLTGFQMPQALQQEMETRAKEEALREEITFKYAEQHRYKTVAQVFVNGKFAAEVNEAGGYGLQNSVSGLSKESLSPQQRTQEIARTLAGSGRVEIRTSNFEAGLGAWMGPGAPDELLPAFTARSYSEIFRDAREAAVRK